MPSGFFRDGDDLVIDGSKIFACLEEVVSCPTERTQFGKPIASYQLVQEMIADISLDADAARLLTWRAAD